MTCRGSLLRELQLWVQAGLSPAEALEALEALEAATRTAALALGADRLGALRLGTTPT